jgi:hypothetical protein
MGATLRQGGKSVATVRVYGGTIRKLGAFLSGLGMPTSPEAITAEHLREFLVQPAAPASARLYYSLRDVIVAMDVTYRRGAPYTLTVAGRDEVTVMPRRDGVAVHWASR